jgi:hypothetical protein
MKNKTTVSGTRIACYIIVLICISTVIYLFQHFTCNCSKEASLEKSSNDPKIFEHTSNSQPSGIKPKINRKTDEKPLIADDKSQEQATEKIIEPENTEKNTRKIKSKRKDFEDEPVGNAVSW